jgi:DNA-binding SARP family transcriptional activator
VAATDIVHATPAKSKLRVYLLGPPRVEWAGRALGIPRRQVRALLYCLAARPQPAPREHLCFLFWPDSPESTSRRNLSHLLTHLRGVLPSPEVLLTPDDHVGLDFHRVWSDVVAFDRLCTTLELQPSEAPRSDAPRRGPDERLRTPRRVEALQQAVDLYRGPFLAGFSLPTNPEFEAWITREQRARENLYLKALADLTEEHAARDECDAAIACAQRYLMIDDLAEDVHRRLISLYAAAGDRSAALRQFERCAAALERELGVSPLPATRAVYQAVLEDQRPTPKIAAARLTWATLPSLDVPLVGRDGAWYRLERAYAHACAGQGWVILISGEPGIGKSRLMQDFATRLQDQALVLVGAGQPGEQALPYHPVAQALRTILSTEPFDRLRAGSFDHGRSVRLRTGSFDYGRSVRLGAGSSDDPNTSRLMFGVQPIWLAEASRLMPELRALWPDLPPPVPAEPDEARTRLFEALCQITLGLAAGPRPLIMCLDDLHWFDGATLDWLAYLGRHLQDTRLLILGTYRHEEASAVDRLRHSLTRLGALTELRLAGLDTLAVRELLHHLIGPVRDSEVLADRLQQSTGGNPFFLLEILRSLAEAGRLAGDPADLGEFPLPDSVREAVEARLQRLSPQARQVLEAGAILGETFSFDLVHRTAGRREMETMDSLDELVARQLLVEKPAGYRYQHALTRQAVEAALSPVRAQLLHRRAGRALEELDPQAVAALALHFDAGGRVRKALHYHNLATQRAEDLSAWEEVEKHQSRMLELLDRLDPDRSHPDCLEQRGQVLAARAHSRFLQGRLAERDADLESLDGLAEASGDESLRLLTLVHRVRYLNMGGQYREAIATAGQGLLLADHLDAASARCRLLAYVGFAHYFLGQPEPALAALESALAEAGEEAGPEMRGRITHLLGYVYLHLGNYTRALTYDQEAYACHQQAGDPNRMAWNLLDIGFLHLKLGRFAKAEGHLTEGMALAHRIGARPAEAYALTYLGYWELYRGHYAAAVDRLRQALPMQEAVHSEHGCVATENGAGLAYHHLGDLARARHWLGRAVERARAIDHRRRLVEALIGRGLVEMADGEPFAAHRCLAEAVAAARDSKCQEGLAAGLAALACAERQLAAGVASPAAEPGGNLTSALEHAREAVRVAQESTLPVCEMWGEMEVGLTLLAQREPEAAIEHTERAIALVPHAHEGWIGTEQIYLAHARVLRALDRAEAADEQIRLASAVVQDKADHIPNPQQRQRYLQSHRLA